MSRPEAPCSPLAEGAAAVAWQLVGYDVRVDSPTWSPERRNTHLLDSTLPRALSADTAVWPAASPDTPRDFWGVFLSLSRARQLANAGDRATTHLIAIGVPTEREPFVGFPAPDPAEIAGAWTFLGHDLTDASFCSFLSNMGAGARRAALWPSILDRLNSNGLVDHAAPLGALIEAAGRLIPKHAPFTAVGLWSVPSDADQSVAAAPKRILFVENHATFAKTVTETFLADLEVVIAPSLAKARRELAGSGFDVVLVDYDLDDGKGDALVRELRANGFGGKIIAASSHDEGNASLLAAGADLVCRKADFRRIRGLLDQ